MWPRPSTRTLALGFMKFWKTIPWSSLLYSLSNICLGVEKKIFKEIHQFYTFYPQISSSWGEGHQFHNLLSPYPRDATYQIWLRLAQ